jgi:hypothetical protein
MSKLVVNVAGDVVVRRVHEAAVSIRAILLRLGELGQLDVSQLT